MGTIHTHVSNFIDTWEGWVNVINGLAKFDFEKIYASFKVIGEVAKVATSSLLSSK
ncbi:hypothetical protein CIP100161_01913 [Corynebacterium diphtheriae]|nr:hypothetical protein CIP100161_01913 [Corynebacterium diphtheriae]CAB0658347.1 hypothetical protein CIP107565_01733 [Corynebacterium diphtheriae]